MSGIPAAELYARKQLHHRLGYALFEPDPRGAYDRVRVGDVGYVSDGAFVRLFNAFHGADSPVNQGATLPANFVPIGETFRSLSFSRSLPPGPKTSGHVRASRVGETLPASGPNTSLAARRKIELHCESRSGGAALLMHHSANIERAVAGKAMEYYIVENHASWLAMVQEQGRSVHLNDLIFVEGCTLTGDWTTMAWNEASLDSKLSFNIGTADAADISASPERTWEERGSVPMRQGPVRTDLNRMAYGRLEFDQCIFLKGLRVSVRGWYNTLLSEVKNEREGGSDSNPSGSVLLHSLSKVGFNVETIGNMPSTFRPVQNIYDLMAIFIFDKSDADIAVVGDNDLNVFNRGQLDSLELICHALIDTENTKVVVSASEEGGKKKIGRISRRDPEPSVFLEQDLIVLDEFNCPLQMDDETQADHPESVSESSDSGFSSSHGRAVVHTCDCNSDE